MIALQLIVDKETRHLLVSTITQMFGTVFKKCQDRIENQTRDKDLKYFLELPRIFKTFLLQNGAC